jgi:hypothetical protein
MRARLGVCLAVVAVVVASGTAAQVPAGPAGSATPVDAVFAPVVKAIKTAVLSEFTPSTKASQAALAGRLATAQQQADAGLCGDALPLVRSVEAAVTSPSAPVRITGPLGATLLPRLLSVEASILSSGGAAACGGPAHRPLSTLVPVPTVVSSDLGQVTVSVALPAVHFGQVSGPDGTPFLSLAQPTLGRSPGTVFGDPDIPAAPLLVALPQGTWPQVTVSSAEGYSLTVPEPVAPLQDSPPPVNTTADAPTTVTATAWAYDADAYASSAAWPPTAHLAQPPTEQRGLRLAAISVPEASYVPATGALDVHTAVTVQITFCAGADQETCIPNGAVGAAGGGPAAGFGTTDLVAPSNAPFISLWQDEVVNWHQVAGSPLEAVARFACGEEMMLVTPPAYVAAADAYATDRTAHGVVTKVFSTDVIGTTTAQIHAAIASQMASSCADKPSYVLLFGFTSQVPTFEVTLPYSFWEVGTPPAGACPGGAPVATDQPYGFIHQWSSFTTDLRGTGDGTCRTSLDLTPDLFVGRITSPTSDVLARMTAYEDSPPVTKSSYRSVLGASFFETPLSDSTFPSLPSAADRTKFCADAGRAASTSRTTQAFIRSAETVGGLVAAAGKTFVREYVDSDQCPTSSPQLYSDGTPLPPGLLTPSAWQRDNAAAAGDLRTAISRGAPVVWHIDHGWSDGSGWGQPKFSNDEADGLTLPSGVVPPVVFSFDCDSGKFDFGGGFANVVQGSVDYGLALEAWWAVAHVGASRESPIHEDEILLQLTMSALYPDYLDAALAKAAQPPVQPVATLGPLVQAGKDLERAADPTSWGAPLVALEFNIAGDPSLSIHRDVPTVVPAKKVQFSVTVAPDSGTTTVQASTGTAKVPRNASALFQVVRDGVVLADCYGSFSGCTLRLIPAAGGTTDPAALAQGLSGAALVVSADGMVPVHRTVGA